MRKKGNNYAIIVIIVIVALVGAYYFTDLGSINLRGFSLLTEINDEKAVYSSGESFKLQADVTWFTGGWNPAYIADKMFYQVDDNTPVKIVDRSDTSGNKMVAYGRGNSEVIFVQQQSITILAPETDGVHSVTVYYFVHNPHDNPNFIASNWDNCPSEDVTLIGDCGSITEYKKTTFFNVGEVTEETNDGTSCGLFCKIGRWFRNLFG